MAQRRMFSLKVIDTDMFLEMPISSRLLYYDLAMRADDDGFVDSPKKILKMIGCSEDDLKILCAKQYLIPFETGVCVIKHWNIHNLIRHDRYTATQCTEEKNALLKENGKYVIPNGNQLATQVRLGKVSIDKEKIIEVESSAVNAQDSLDIVMPVKNNEPNRKTEIKRISPEEQKKMANATPLNIPPEVIGKPKVDPEYIKIRDITIQNMDKYCVMMKYEPIYWDPKQRTQLKNLINRVRTGNNYEQTMKKLKELVNAFATLKESGKDYWIEKPFTPAVLYSQYDNIMAAGKKK